jgi:hypothetical protein
MCERVTGTMEKFKLHQHNVAHIEALRTAKILYCCGRGGGVMTPCSVLGEYQRSGKTHCIRFKKLSKPF